MKYNSFNIVFELQNKIDSNVFNKNIFDETGIFILRNLIPQTTIKEWQGEWNSFYTQKLSTGRNINQANPVALKETLPEKLAYMYRNENLINIAKQIHGEDIALYNHRFVIKDKFSLEKVFLHNDSCYHLGYLNKCSFFVPLSHSGPLNGGLTFHLGTHKYGYLGDAGEINKDAFDIQGPTITPELYPGDIAIMHSSLWHESGPNISKEDRILADIHYQPANDPTSKELLSGEWKTDFWYPIDDPTKYFINSRILKLKNITK
jgi:ectoine hydroxylase-related dioxygenase (phytanoyl-CoA dioxygenase family)